MTYDSEYHRRRSIRLPTYDYSQEGAYYLTICIRGRFPILGEVRKGTMIENECGSVVRAVWVSLAERYTNVATDAFVVMPNHLHGILVFGPNPDNDDAPVGAIHESPLPDVDDPDWARHRRRMLLPRVVGYLKMNAAKRINLLISNTGHSLWQRDYFERVVRSEDELNRIRQYIADNPACWEEDDLFVEPTDPHRRRGDS